MKLGSINFTWLVRVLEVLSHNQFVPWRFRPTFTFV